MCMTACIYYIYFRLIIVFLFKVIFLFVIFCICKQSQKIYLTVQHIAEQNFVKYVYFCDTCYSVKSILKAFWMGSGAAAGHFIHSIDHWNQ